MAVPKITDVTILEKTGKTPSKIAVKYSNKRRYIVIDDAELVPLIMLSWAASIVRPKNLIETLNY